LLTLDKVYKPSTLQSSKGAQRASSLLLSTKHNDDNNNNNNNNRSSKQNLNKKTKVINPDSTMFRSKKTKTVTLQDIEVSEWIDCALTDSQGRLFINTLDPAQPSPCTTRPHNICELKASVPIICLSDYLTEKWDSLPPLTRDRFFVEHKTRRGECECSFQLTQSRDSMGSPTGSLYAEHARLTRECARAGFDLGRLHMVLQFVLLCRVALRLPVSGTGRLGEHLKGVYGLRGN
jgi:hypothetical protein